MEDLEPEDDQYPEDDMITEMPDLQIITLVFDNSTGDIPSLDLGNVSPFVAITLLQSAINTLEMLIPPVDVSYKGRVVCSSSFEIIDDDCDD
jgi:hypothetical protein